MSRLEGLEERAKRWDRLNKFDKSLSEIEDMVTSWEGDLPGMPVDPDQIAAIEVIASVAKRFALMIQRLKQLRPGEYSRASRRAEGQDGEAERSGEIVEA